MPVNIALTFLFGWVLGWIVIKLLKPKPYLEGLVMAASSTGNLGYLLLIIIPAICDENGTPFGDHDTCSSLGLSYASFSMAVVINLSSFNLGDSVQIWVLFCLI